MRWGESLSIVRFKKYLKSKDVLWKSLFFYFLENIKNQLVFVICQSIINRM